ncbi:hypothetical protein Ato02nite_058060 [Paractinoplanes toevensis]|uniref:Uncharacterized protein n=1 Tax=Paractinoplanes toevensis TaxID=571911 RepID=A0A919TE92_9ACTN|nr:hypothetical protein Ato02nite_058060 [Actinoplanes toevensis]
MRVTQSAGGEADGEVDGGGEGEDGGEDDGDCNDGDWDDGGGADAVVGGSGEQPARTRHSVTANGGTIRLSIGDYASPSTHPLMRHSAGRRSGAPCPSIARPHRVR